MYIATLQQLERNNSHMEKIKGLGILNILVPDQFTTIGLCCKELVTAGCTDDHRYRDPSS